MKTTTFLRAYEILGLLAASTAKAQVVPAAAPFFTGFNSSFSLSPEQIELGSLDEALTNSINTVINFDRSSQAYGGPNQDDFYRVPPQVNATQPGQVIKLQEVTDPSQYAIASGSSLTRMLFTTTNLNGTVIPASAYILWPFQPRRRSANQDEAATKADAILWGHGTSGYFADSAPSAHRTLYYENMMSLQLAQAGYAVVAPDYAGLGVDRSWNGSFIPNQPVLMPAMAHDMLYALQAAQSVFADRLSGDFAVVGHSQGGGVAWATAELLASGEFDDLSEGYVGTVSFAPLTQSLSVPGFGVATVGMNLDRIFPDFSLDQWLTPLALGRVELMRQIQGTATVAQQLFLNLNPEEVLKDGWYDSSYHAAAVERLADAGGKPFAGPLLVVQGTEDFFITDEATSGTVDATCDVISEQHLEYMVVEGFGHTPILGATRQIWMDWLDDRFERKPVDAGCKRTSVSGWLGSEKHFVGSNSYSQWAGLPEYMYQNPGAI